MLDNQLITLIVQTIIAGEVSTGINGTPIAAAYQPTNQGINTQPTGYLWKIGDKRIGSPARHNYIGTLNLITENGQNITGNGQNIIVDKTPVHSEAQWYETTLQFSVLATQNPATPNQYTASDILNLIASILQSDATIAALEAQDVGVLRIKDIRNPYFLDDRSQFEANPSMDVIFTHLQIIQTAQQVITETVINIFEV